MRGTAQPRAALAAGLLLAALVGASLVGGAEAKSSSSSSKDSKEKKTGLDAFNSEQRIKYLQLHGMKCASEKCTHSEFEHALKKELHAKQKENERRSRREMYTREESAVKQYFFEQALLEPQQLIGMDIHAPCMSERLSTVGQGACVPTEFIISWLGDKTIPPLTLDIKHEPAPFQPLKVKESQRDGWTTPPERVHAVRSAAMYLRTLRIDRFSERVAHLLFPEEYWSKDMDRKLEDIKAHMKSSGFRALSKLQQSIKHSGGVSNGELTAEQERLLAKAINLGLNISVNGLKLGQHASSAEIQEAAEEFVEEEAEERLEEIIEAQDEASFIGHLTGYSALANDAMFLAAAGMAMAVPVTSFVVCFRSYHARQQAAATERGGRQAAPGLTAGMMSAYASRGPSGGDNTLSVARIRELEAENARLRSSTIAGATGGAGAVPPMPALGAFAQRSADDFVFEGGLKPGVR